jgi:O-glycosyl hydrolase
MDYFSLNAPSWLWTVLSDIFFINPRVSLYVVPWSPPYWMKDTGTMRGGTLKSNMTTAYAKYLFQSVKALNLRGYTVYAVGVQVRALYHCQAL